MKHTQILSFTAQESGHVVPTRQKARYIAVDYLRGFAILLMTLDHSFGTARFNVRAESYNGIAHRLGSWPHIFIGLVTNVASIIFFTLAGMSVAFFESSRRCRGWTEWQISGFLLTRALILFILDRTVINFVYEGPAKFDVLSALAFCLMVLTFIRLLPLRIVGILAVAFFLVYPILVNLFPFNSQQPLSLVATVLLQHQRHLFPFVEFPLMGWLSLVLGGYVVGRLLQEQRLTINLKWLWAAGAGIGIAFVLRLLGGYGNFFPYQSTQPFIYFFVENKQPPSVVFLLWNLSIVTAMLTLINHYKEKINRTLPAQALLVFAQTSLFFYLLHLLVYRKVLGQLIPGTFSYGFIRAAIFLSIGLLIMFPLCRFYRGLRQRYPNGPLCYF